MKTIWLATTPFFHQLEINHMIQQPSEADRNTSRPLKMPITYLIYVLHSLGNTNCLHLSKFVVRLENDFDEKLTKDIFQNVMGIIQEKFPKVPTKLEFYEDVHYFTIIKKKGNLPRLTQCKCSCDVRPVIEGMKRSDSCLVHVLN